MENLNPPSKGLETIPSKPLEDKTKLKEVDGTVPSYKIKLAFNDYYNIVKAFFLPHDKKPMELGAERGEIM